MALDSRGHEVVSNVPVELPVGARRPESLVEQIKRMVRHELSQAGAAQGFETFEEADDFDVGDDYDPKSPWELTADQEEFSLSKAPPEAKEAAQASKPAEPATPPAPKSSDAT